MFLWTLPKHYRTAVLYILHVEPVPGEWSLLTSSASNQVLDKLSLHLLTGVLKAEFWRRPSRIRSCVRQQTALNTISYGGIFWDPFYDDEWLRETKKSMMGSSILEIITNLILQVRLGEWEEATTKFKLIRRTSLTSSVSSDGTFGFIWLILNRSVKRSSHNLAIRQFDCNYILFTTRKHFFILPHEIRSSICTAYQCVALDPAYSVAIRAWNSFGNQHRTTWGLQSCCE